VWLNLNRSLPNLESCPRLLICRPYPYLCLSMCAATHHSPNDLIGHHVRRFRAGRAGGAAARNKLASPAWGFSLAATIPAPNFRSLIIEHTLKSSSQSHGFILIGLKRLVLTQPQHSLIMAVIAVIGGLLGIVALYLAGLAAYRLFLSPLSKFPGPKLAALSNWYEFYYDVVLHGQFTAHLQKLHKRYGE
jgi:hypothetical protein